MKPEEVILQFGFFMQTARLDRGMTKTQLSNLSGVSTYLITRIEKSKSISLDALSKIIVALNLNIKIIDDYVIKENFDEYYERRFGKYLRKNLDQANGIFGSIDPAQIKVNWAKIGKI